MTSLYAVLGVEPDAKTDEIKRAYRKKTLEFHPDKHGNTVEATERFRRIQDAHDVLVDARRRAMYDAGHVDPESPDNVLRGTRFGRAFKSSGDVRTDLVAVTTSLAELVLHNVVSGLVKNLLLVLLAITASITAGWWGVVLSLASFLVLGWSAQAWFRILFRSPLGTSRPRES